MRLLVLAAIGLAVVAGSARAAGPPVFGFSISSGSRALAPLSLPSAALIARSIGVSSRPAAFATVSVGASATALTVIVTVAGPLSTVPSFALYVKLSEPLKFAFGA